eukprot:6657673-Ditylum_brightwellii.AAC.1
MFPPSSITAAVKSFKMYLALHENADITNFYAMVDSTAAKQMDSDPLTRVDNSTASLGKHYKCTDEVGILFAVTIDFDSLKDNTVMLQEGDSIIQIRLPKSNVAQLFFDLVHSRMTWDEAKKKHPAIQVNEDKEVAEAKSDL